MCCVIVEVYLSIVWIILKVGEIFDQVQVRIFLNYFELFDFVGKFGVVFNVFDLIFDREKYRIIYEEGWILVK